MPAIPTAATDLLARLALRVAAALLLLLVVRPAAAQAERPITVSYVSASAVYLDAGSAAGLDVGARLRLVRDGAEIAEVEVDFVAEHSASCRIVRAPGSIRTGDRAILIAAAPAPPAGEGEPALPPSETPPATRELPAPRLAPQPDGPSMRTSGSLALGWRRLSSDAGPQSTETGGRLSLRLAEIAGRPLTVRLRLRSREVERDGYRSTLARSQSSDRLYEASVAWDPPEGRFALQLGRLAASRFSTLGYLDGALAEVRLGGGFAAGAFGGARPELAELGFDSTGTRYGAYGRWETARDRPGDGWAEILVGGVTETADGGETDRDYVAVESRFGSGSRWWLSQRAEIDFHRGWREEVAGSTSQLSNAALAASVQLSPAWRASLSYDQRRNLLTWEDRPRPEEVFVRHFREGARLGLDWRGDGGWSAGLGGGLERAREIDDPTTSAWLSLFKSGLADLPLSLGGDASLYAGGTAEGYVANLRAGWTLRGGHDLALTLGASEARLTDYEDLDPRLNQWARLSGTAQLPYRLWLYGEYELLLGDDSEGDRAALEVGYRF